MSQQNRPELVDRAKPIHHDPRFRELRDEVLPKIRHILGLTRKTGVAMSTQWLDFSPAGDEGDKEFDAITHRESAKILFDPDFFGCVRVLLRSADRSFSQLMVFVDLGHKREEWGTARPPIRGKDYRGKLAMSIGVLSGIQAGLYDQAELLEVAYNAILEKMTPAEAKDADGEVGDERPAAGEEESGTGELALEPAAVDATAGNGEDEAPKPEGDEPKKPRLRKSDGKPYGSPKDVA